MQVWPEAFGTNGCPDDDVHEVQYPLYKQFTQLVILHVLHTDPDGEG